MTALRAAVSHAAARLGLSYDTAMLLPIRVVIELEETREREAERERLKPARQKTEAELMQPPVTVLREGGKR